MTTCPTCGAQQFVRSSFCDQCGAPLPAPTADGAACVHCSAAVEPGARFCEMCGMPLLSVTAKSDTAPVSRQPLRAASRLIVMGSGSFLPLAPDRSQFLIGREDVATGVFPDIDLALYGGEQGGVSRRHARITAQGDDLSIEDLDSTNGTFVNRRRLRPGAPVTLRHGDEIRIGDVLLRFHVG